MIKVDIIAVGKLKEKFFIEAQNEYAKRLSKYCRLTITEIEEKPHTGPLAASLEEEAQKIFRIVGVNPYTALCVEGAKIDSPSFSGFMERMALSGDGLKFVIGGSDGLSNSVKTRAAAKISFSDMTFPHHLMRVILLEQIYRGFKISNNEIYHK